MRTRKRILLAGGLLLLLSCGLICSLSGYQLYLTRYNRNASLAQTALEHLQSGEKLLRLVAQHPLDASTVKQTRHEFESALPALQTLNGDLQSLPDITTSLPIYGTQLHAAMHLVPLAIAMTQAGITLCSLLDTIGTRFRNPFGTPEAGLTLADLALIGQGIDRIQQSLDVAWQEIRQLQPDDLRFNQRIATFVRDLRTQLPQLQQWFVDSKQFLTVAPIVLGIGTPAHYLIEVLDATELRPEGGFVGNYGIVTLANGQLAETHITDISMLDHPFEEAGNRIPFPPKYRWFDLVPNWSLRDVGLDADFPTVARYSETNYALEGGSVPLQGVIAITPDLIEHILTITGPVEVPEYHETITAQNLIARIHYHQLSSGAGSGFIASPDGYSSQRKHFIALLAEHLFARIHQIAPEDLSQFITILKNALYSKDLQVYFNAGPAQQLLQDTHADAAIQTTQGDGLMVVDANIAGDKANSFITSAIEDQVTITEQGTVLHRTTLRYSWTRQGPVYGNPQYRSYVRVYVPNGSTLRAQDGWQPRGTSSDFDHAVWAGIFTLSYGQIRTITLTWEVHFAGNGRWTYLIQRQAGIMRTMHLSVTLPSCAKDIRTEGKGIIQNKQNVTFDQPLQENTAIGIVYACR